MIVFGGETSGEQMSCSVQYAVHQVRSKYTMQLLSKVQLLQYVVVAANSRNDVGRSRSQTPIVRYVVDLLPCFYSGTMWGTKRHCNTHTQNDTTHYALPKIYTFPHF